MTYVAKILKDSVSTLGGRLTSLELRYPRFVHSELLTHRKLSRNSASSRAIPVQKMLRDVWNNPVVPVWIGKNQTGMSAKEELNGWRRSLAVFVWLFTSKVACILAWTLWKIGMHKQIANRVVEPWMWITVIVTATEWDNFFALRCHPDAQPEIQRIATLAREAMALSVPERVDVRFDGYHLPLVSRRDFINMKMEGLSIEEIVKVSVGRCARVSYLTHDGKRDPKADIALCDRLIASGHMSPAEHAAFDDETVEQSGNFLGGWLQWRKTLPFEANFAERKV